jgi:hypothetical protein
VTDELKNALAFNIANIYYMLGNAEEGKKYEALYTIRDKDEVIKPKNALTNNATAGRNETLVVNEEFWCPADKYKLLFKVEYPTIISSASNGNN